MIKSINNWEAYSFDQGWEFKKNRDRKFKATRVGKQNEIKDEKFSYQGLTFQESQGWEFGRHSRNGLFKFIRDGKMEVTRVGKLKLP